MTIAAGESGVTSLDALVKVFAVMFIGILVLFAVTMVLAARHRRQRPRALSDLADEERWSDSAGRLDNLTVGDLVSDPELRHSVLVKRSRLAEIVITKDETKDQPGKDPDPPASSGA